MTLFCCSPILWLQKLASSVLQQLDAKTIPPQIILKGGSNDSKFHVINRVILSHYHEQRKETQKYKKKLNVVNYYFTFLQNLNSHQINFCCIIWLYIPENVLVSM